MDKIKGSFAVLAGAASFGVLSTFVKKAYEEGYTLGEITGVQALLGAVVLWAIYMGSRRKSAMTAEHKLQPWWLVLLSGFSTGAVSILYYQCVQLVPASVAIVLLMQYIWIGSLLDWVLFGKRPSLAQVIGSLAVLGGTALATGIFENALANISTRGLAFGLAAAASYALFILLNGRIGNGYAAPHKSALMVSGALLLILLTLQPWSILANGVFLGVLPFGIFLAAFGTIIPPLLFAYGMPKTGYELGSILSAIELPVAVALSFFVLKETVTLWQWFGVTLILMVIVVINRRANKHG